MSHKRFIEHGHSISWVDRRLGVTTKRIYNWLDRYSDVKETYQQEGASKAQINRRQEELPPKSAYLKGGRRVLCRRDKENYVFIESIQTQYLMAHHGFMATQTQARSTGSFDQDSQQTSYDWSELLASTAKSQHELQKQLSRQYRS